MLFLLSEVHRNLNLLLVDSPDSARGVLLQRVVCGLKLGAYIGGLSVGVPCGQGGVGGISPEGFSFASLRMPRVVVCRESPFINF